MKDLYERARERTQDFSEILTLSGQPTESHLQCILLAYRQGLRDGCASTILRQEIDPSSCSHRLVASMRDTADSIVLCVVELDNGEYEIRAASPGTPSPAVALAKPEH